MSTIDPTATLGALVVERPARAARLDYCCGGSQTLAEACSTSTGKSVMRLQGCAS